ncbi:MULTISPECIES: siderophore ABC transporter substrate-binding protein [unclassified Acinetobacter]|uniref:siderophore ABC transporter substrate-binding protein n=1 Tax=unclassified Acinetobacter TaxID=196816 RepID=UPI00190942FA|nr:MULTISPECIES: ABC transporter substrate-binding protein [unclassified Acinetobacter]MBK0063388.1 ABC transporter substrate-binding protein [Acinetobacter sp. S55]MBK0066700.1 ABC transporter substrate-binding protein [Acinetobacter sp. S54]
MLLKKTFIATLFTLIFVGCSNSNTSTQSEQGNTAKNATNDILTFSSKAGDITIPANVSRIAVLDTNALNTIHELGADDKVVALPKGTPLPHVLRNFNDSKYIDVGTVKDPNLERVAASQPQLVLMSGRMENVINEIKTIAPTYFVDVDYNDQFNSFKQQTLNIAEMVGKKAEAEQQLQTLESDIATLKERTQGKTALIIMVNNSKIAAYGAGSRFGNIHDLYGFTPVDPSIKVGLHGMAISYEFIAQKNPDYIFVIDRGAAISEKKDGAKQVLSNAIINKTKAAQNGHIVYLDSSNWYLMNNGLGGMKAMVKEVSNAVND